MNRLSTSSGIGKKNGGKPAPISHAKDGFSSTFGARDQLGRAPLDHQSLGRGGAVVVVEPHEVDARVPMRAADSGVAS